MKGDFVLVSRKGEIIFTHSDPMVVYKEFMKNHRGDKSVVMAIEKDGGRISWHRAVPHIVWDVWDLSAKPRQHAGRHDIIKNVFSVLERHVEWERDEK